MLFSSIVAHHVIASRTIRVQRIQILIGHNHWIPLTIKSCVLCPNCFCTSLEIPVIAERRLDSLLLEVIDETFDVDPVLAEIHIALVRSKWICGVPKLGVKQSVLRKYRVFCLKS